MRKRPRKFVKPSWRPLSNAQYYGLVSKADDILFHGNRGGGKTDLLLADFCRDVNKGFGAEWRGILFRQTFPQLEEVVIKSHLWFNKWFPGAKWNASKYMWRFPNGEVLYLRYIKNMGDYNNYHGQQFAWLGFEELTGWHDPAPLDAMDSCLRSTNPNIHLRKRGTTNPAGIGHAWVKKKYIIGKPATMIKNEIGETQTHFFIDLKKNKFIMENQPKYIKRLSMIKDPNLLKAWYKGSWDIVAGGRFSHVWDSGFHVLPNFIPPANWYIDRGFDWGSSKPFSVGWYCECDGSEFEIGGITRHFPKGTIIRFAEYYGWNGQPNVGIKMTSSEIGKNIIQYEKEMGIYGRVRPGPADSSIFDVTEVESIADKMARVGCSWKKADKRPGSRINGWELIADRLSAGTSVPMESPGFFVTKNNVNFIRTIPDLPRDDKKIDDINTNAEDHIADEVRYRILAGYRPVKMSSLPF